MSKYIDYDKLDDNILALNEKGWEITRGEYKRIQSVMFEMIELEIPDNATNGDMIKALFDVKEVRKYRTRVVVWTLLNGNIEPIDFQLKWWNALYKKGEQE